MHGGGSKSLAPSGLHPEHALYVKKEYNLPRSVRDSGRFITGLKAHMTASYASKNGHGATLEFRVDVDRFWCGITPRKLIICAKTRISIHYH